MPGEELFELNEKIGQIRNNINKRKEKVVQWNVPYQKILSKKTDKSIYLHKFYNPTSNSQNPPSNENFRADLKRKVVLSRKKIHQYHNELKELDELVRSKNLIRCARQGRSDINYSLHKDTEDEPIRQMRIKLQNEKNISTDSENISNFNRTLKDRTNPFQNAKADKFIDFYSQIKGGEDVRPQMMRTFGVGLENTPLGRMIRQQSKKEQIKNNKEKNKRAELRKGRRNLAESFNKAFSEKENIWGNVGRPNLFENRMKKIINYHGQFWKKSFEIK